MKEKISITIDSELIKKVDKFIDGETVRNRSQALEHLIRKSINQKGAETAVILAGGDISKLRFGDTYKPLAKVEGTALILNAIQKLKEAGVKIIIIAAGPITDKVFELVGDGSEYGVTIIYLKDEGTGTAGAIKSAEKHIKGSFFVVFGDEYFDFDLARMVEFHTMNGNPATMAIAVTALEKSKDSVKIMGNRIIEFEYQPKAGETTHYVNAGIYLLNRSVLDIIPSKGSLEKELFPSLTKKGQLTGFVFSGSWKHLM